MLTPVLPAHALADEEGRGQGQDGGGEERGVEQAEGEEGRAVLPGQRLQGQGGVGGRLHPDPGLEQGRRAGQDDESGDDGHDDAPDDDVEAGVLVVLDHDVLLDDGRLEVELHPGGDGRPDEADDHPQRARGEVEARAGRGSSRSPPSPAWPGTRRRCR